MPLLMVLLSEYLLTLLDACCLTRRSHNIHHLPISPWSDQVLSYASLDLQ